MLPAQDSTFSAFLNIIEWMLCRNVYSSHSRAMANFYIEST